MIKIILWILFFPIMLPSFIWAARRRAKRELTRVKEPTPWGIQLIDDDGIVYAEETAKLVDEEDMVLYAEFNILDSVTIVESRAMRHGKILCKKEIPPIVCTEHDIIKMRHALVFKEKETVETVKNAELCRLQLMTSNSKACREGSFPCNEYALIDNGDMESLGKSLKVKFIDWYLKATWSGGDGAIRTSYNPESALFKEIQAGANARNTGCLSGPELVLELESGKRVTFFCGTLGSKRGVANICHERNALHLLEIQTFDTMSRTFVAPKITPIKAQALWMGKPISKLDDGHLWNIIQAVETGQWASGAPAWFDAVTTTALADEYARRKIFGVFSKKRVKKIKKHNKEYEDRNKATRI